MAPSSQEEGRGDGSTLQAWIETASRRGTLIIEDLPQTAVSPHDQVLDTTLQ